MVLSVSCELVSPGRNLTAATIGLVREDFPFGQCGRTALLVGLTADEMALMVEVIVHVGMVGHELLLVVRPVSYSIYALTAKGLAHSSVAGELKHSITSGVGITAQVGTIALLVAPTQIDWEKAIGQQTSLIQRCQ